MPRSKKSTQRKITSATSKPDHKSSVPSTGLYGVRDTSKLGKILAMLRQKNGATLEALCKATGWQSHSVRGALSGTIKKKLGLTIISAKTAGVRTYRISN